jgi:hypothetical protein
MKKIKRIQTRMRNDGMRKAFGHQMAYKMALSKNTEKSQSPAPQERKTHHKTRKTHPLVHR